MPIFHPVCRITIIQAMSKTVAIKRDVILDILRINEKRE